MSEVVDDKVCNAGTAGMAANKDSMRKNSMRTRDLKGFLPKSESNS